MDQEYGAIYRSKGARGTDLHYTEIAAALSLTPERGRENLRDLVGLGSGSNGSSAMESGIPLK